MICADWYKSFTLPATLGCVQTNPERMNGMFFDIVLDYLLLDGVAACLTWLLITNDSSSV